MLRIAIGYDPRQAISYNVLQYSIATKSSKLVQITPLVIEQIEKLCGFNKVGLTPFTYSRFIVPYLFGFEGWALFLDADMLVLDDISKLFDAADDKYTVMIVKNKQRFEWASAILFNCAKCRMLTPDFVRDTKGLHGFDFLYEDSIGALPPEWNHLVGYSERREDASLVHFTQGVPAFPETRGCEYTEQWMTEHKSMNSAEPWVTLMGNSVHATIKDGKIIPKLAA